MRILQVLYTLGKSDGSANVIMNLYRNINRLNVQFDFVYFKDSDNSFNEEILDLGGNIHKIQLESIYDVFSIPLNINKILKDKSNLYKAIHVNFPLFGFFIFGAAKRNGIKHLILHAHSSSYGSTFPKKIRNYILYTLSRYRSTIYLACSRPAGRFLFGKNNWDKGKVKLINNAIDCLKYEWNENTRKEYRHNFNLNEYYVVGHIGRFSLEKNHTYILKIFKEVIKIHPKSKLMLVGAGPELDNIKNLVKQLDLVNDVIFTGVRNDIHNLLQVMDIFLMPSLFEGLPVTLVEAQASGLPCVVSDNVPFDSCIIPSLYSNIPLNFSPVKWANNVIKFKDMDRKSTYNQMKAKGFDIKEISTELESWYKSL